MVHGNVMHVKSQTPDYAIIKAKILEELPKPKLNLQGSCASCLRGIPFGYLALVTDWKSENINGYKLAKPEVMYCQECAKAVTGEPAKRYKYKYPEPDMTQPEVPAKAQAIALLKAMEKGKYYTSRKVAEIAKLPYTKLFKQVLRKLKSMGKLKLEDGRWIRV